MNYYERHLGDYAKDTAHLTMIEHGAYTLLLDRYYSTETPISADQAHRLARARTKEEREAVDTVLAEFFISTPAGWINRRADEEVAKAQARIESAKSNGKRGGRPKKNPVGLQEETHQEPSGFSLGSENETGSKPDRKLTKLHLPPNQQDQEQVLSTASPPTDLLGPKPDELHAARAQRLAQVTADALETFNASTLVKSGGGLVPNVSSTVGREKRQQQVAKCIRIARDICAENYDSQTITREFWVDYWANCQGDEHKSGRRGGGRDHPDWVPTFEYLTREKTMLEIYDRAAAEDAA